MADTNLPLQITVEQSGEKVSEQNNSGSFRVAAATALLALSLATGNPAKAEQPAQPTQLAAVTTPAASVPTAAKGLGYGQMTQDGRKYENLSEEDVDGLSRPEKKAYYTWKNIQLDQAAIEDTTRIEMKKQAAIAQYREYIEVFLGLDKIRNSPGFDNVLYSRMKTELKKVLKDGQPQAIATIIKENKYLYSLLDT